MIFPRLNFEPILQVEDKTRLDANPTFIENESSAITLLQIEPEAGAGLIDVTTKKYLDWEYASEGTKVVTVEVTTDGAPVTKTFSLSVLSVADDNLFSNDADLTIQEPNILKWVRKGRASFLDYHRRAQTLIFQYLDREGYTKDDGTKWTKEDAPNASEFNEWSTFLTLQLIFDGISNSIGDVFDAKAKHYRSKELDARNRAFLRLDFDGDGTASETEKLEFANVNLVRR